MLLDRINNFDATYSNFLPVAQEFYNKKEKSIETEGENLYFREKLALVFRDALIDTGDIQEVPVCVNLVMSGNLPDLKFFTKQHSKEDVKKYVRNLKKLYN